MRTRPVLLAAVSAAVGLAALGTVVAQPPPSGALPATTVRPYSEWTPTPAPPGGYTPKQSPSGVKQAGYLQPPPGYNPQQPAARKLNGPGVAGGDVRPAGAFDLPPPNMDLPAFRPGSGVAPPPAGGPTPLPPPTGGRPAMPPAPVDSKFAPSGPAVPSPAGVIPGPTDPKPGVPPVPPGPAPVGPLPLPAPAGSPALPPAPAALPPTSPAPQPDFAPPAGPSPFPVAVPSGPASPASPQPVADAAPTGPAAAPAPLPAPPTGPVAGPAPAAPPAVGLLPSRTTPSVMVEAVCPETVVYGQEFQYKLIVRNTGAVPVAGARVEDEIPPGARYAGSEPPAEPNGDRLVWSLGALEPNAERVITVRLRPAEEGDVRSRATVTFAAAVDAKTRVTRPRLAVVVTGPEVCRAGEPTTFRIKVTNGGSGPASKWVLHARLTAGLVHSQGTEIEAVLENLPAGASREVPLTVSAAQAGLQACEVLVAADGSPDASAKASVNVVEPMLQVKQSGPAKCLVRAEPTYVIELANPGTAATDPVQVHTVLPDGFEYLQASDGGSVSGRTVTWRLPALAAGSTRAVSVKLRAVAAAEGSLLRTIAQAAPAAPAGGVTGAGGVTTRPAGRGLEAKAETAVTAEGVAAIRFEVLDLEDPVEVGKEATYEVRVANQGTGPCTNLQIAAALSEGTEFVALGPNAPGQVKLQGPHLIFDPVPTLGVKGELVYRVRVKGNAPGDLRFRVQLTCDQLKSPVVKEESTRFYKE